MEELYIQTKSAFMPISSELIKKYSLEKGMISPFSNLRIVGKNGEFPKRNTDEKINGEIEQTENVILTNSEILDFANAADSTNGQ